MSRGGSTRHTCAREAPASPGWRPRCREPRSPSWGAHRGLQVVDLADPDCPRWLARVPSEGDPVALFPRGDLVVVAARRVRVREACPECPGGMRERLSSRLTAVDVSDPAAPRVRSKRDIAGRIVGGVLLDGHLAVLSNGAVQSAVGELALAVYDLSSPDQLPLVGSARFRGSIHRTTLLAAGRRMVVANLHEASTSTTITVLDVDPAGQVTVHSTSTVPGDVRHATYLGLEDAGQVLAVVSVETDGPGQETSKLRTFGLKTEGGVEPLAEVLVPAASTVAIGDARAAVAGTALAVIDLSSPAAPVVQEVSQHAGKAAAVRLLEGGLLVVGQEVEPGGQQPALFAALYDWRGGLVVARGRVTPAIEGHNSRSDSDDTPAISLRRRPDPGPLLRSFPGSTPPCARRSCRSLPWTGNAEPSNRCRPSSTATTSPPCCPSPGAGCWRRGPG